MGSGGKNPTRWTCVLEYKLLANSTEIYNPRKDACKHTVFLSQGKNKNQNKTKKNKKSQNCTVKEEFVCLASGFPWNGHVPGGSVSCWRNALV